jgi:uncharacterized protein with beta-barrel porin domain
MNSPLMAALQQFDMSEANLGKLERLWGEIQSLIPQGVVFGDNPEYEDRCRSFAEVLVALSLIDGWKPSISLPDLNEIAQNRFDAMDLGEIEATISVETAIAAPGNDIREYRFRFNQKRRALIRDTLVNLIDNIDADLRAVRQGTGEMQQPFEKISGTHWDSLREHVAQIDVLLGSAARPPRWGEMRRHLGFGQHQDLIDIEKLDWPHVKAGLRKNPSFGGPVSINLTPSGSISTTGDFATGIISSHLESNTVVAVTASGNISTRGGSANAILVSTAGPIEVTLSGNISTLGTASSGIGVSSSLSLRGGGVSGGDAVSVSVAGSISTNGDKGIGISARSIAGEVTVAISGDISTAGNGASGVAAQTGVGSQLGNPVGGGAVSVDLTSTARVSTKGDNAVGIGAASFGGAVNVTASGQISTTGSTAHGVEAVGLGLPESRQSGRVSVTMSGNVRASGSNSDAIRTESFGGDIGVNVTAGKVTGGLNGAAGVHLIGGGNNSLTNFGTITSVNGLADTAILAEAIPAGTTSVVLSSQTLTVSTPSTVTGNNTINNSGLIIGSVDLGSGTNAFNNRAGGTLEAGPTVKLGTGGTLTNSGNLSPGGKGVVQTTVLTGNLVQTSSGKISVDVDRTAGQADRINVSGTAQLAGQVVANVISRSLASGKVAFTILHADGGVTDDGLTLVQPAVETLQLQFPDPNDLVLQTAIDFAPQGLNGNQTAIGRIINVLQVAGISESFLPVAQALMSLPDVHSLARAYDQLSPETYADNEIVDFYSGLRFAKNLMSCKVPDGRFAFIKEGQCVWAQVGGGFLNLGQTAGNLGYSESGIRLSGGAEVMIQPDWFAGFALGYEHANANTGNTFAKSQIDRAQFGAVVKYNPGPFLLAAAAYGGYGWYTADRFMDFGGFNTTATSGSRISRVGGQLRAAYLVDQGPWYLKPIIDLNATRISRNGFSEHGAGGGDLIVPGSNNVVFSGSPGIEIGAQINLPNDAILRPFARAGVTAFSNTDFAATASFSGVPAGVAPFRVTTGIDAVTADVAVGADLLTTDGVGLKLAYNGHYGARLRGQDFLLKASIRF